MTKTYLSSTDENGNPIYETLRVTADGYPLVPGHKGIIKIRGRYHRAEEVIWDYTDPNNISVTVDGVILDGNLEPLLCLETSDSWNYGSQCQKHVCVHKRKDHPKDEDNDELIEHTCRDCSFWWTELIYQ